MTLVGYKLVENGTGEIVQTWGGIWGQCPGVPNPLVLPNGDQVCAASVDVDYGEGNYRLISWEMEPSEAPFVDLSRPAFLFMAEKIGASEAIVLGLIDAMPEGKPEEVDAKLLAKIVYQNQQTFKRDNVLLESLAKAAKIPDDVIDGAWRVAEKIKW